VIVYKFGGALARSKRGLEALARLVGEAYARELTRARRSTSQKRGKRTPAGSALANAGKVGMHGLVVVVSAIGHTTRQLTRAADLAEEGKLHEAESALDRIVSQHEQLAATLVLEREEDLFETFDEIGTSVRSLLEGIAITRELSPRSRDAVIAHGEQFAVSLVHALLEEYDLPIQVVDARNLILTNESFGHAVPDPAAVAERAQRLIAPRLRKSEVILTQGFAGATADGVTTTMGSESSDLTATLLAASLGAEEVVIWKMLPGIYSADPELVPHARLIRTLSFEEAEEIGRRGARVLFPTFAHPLMQSKSATTLRIATPFATAARHTVLTRVVVSPARRQKPLAVALEEKLVSLRMVRREGKELTDRRARERMQTALAASLANWSTPAETVAVVARDARRSFLSGFDREFYSITDGPPLAAIAVIVRKAKSEPFDATLTAQIARSLRSFHVHAMLPIEQSIVVFVDDANSREALRKLHHDLFES
jgi:aspartate kinase